MKELVDTAPPSRAVFGQGALARLPDELERLGVCRALLPSTLEQANAARALAASFSERAAGVYDGAAMHVPLELAEDARGAARELDAEYCVTVGEGSSTGLGKAIALSSELSIVAVPSTYAGSAMTPIYGLTNGGMKKIGRDPRVLPKTVVYDPTPTLSLAPELSAASGMNAIAHCVEALYAHEGNPVISLMAEEGTRALATALPAVMWAPEDLEALGEAKYGAPLAGIALGATSMALHHKLCHVLGGSFNLSHAETHAIVLPHAERYNRDAAPEAMARVARSLGATDAPGGLHELESKLGLALALKGIGMPADGLGRAARVATDNPYSNPRAVEFDAALKLSRAADADAPGLMPEEDVQ